MNNQEICQHLRRLHTLLTLGRRSNNLALTIRRALEVIPTWHEEAEVLLQRTPAYILFGGYGPKFIKIFQELVTTGHIALLDRLQPEYDPFFCYLCELPSIGETMARRMFFERSIHTMDDLRIAYSNNILQLIPSFGETRLRVIEEVLMQSHGMANVEPVVSSVNFNLDNHLVSESYRNRLKPADPSDELRDVSKEISSYLETHPNEDVDENLSNEIADFVAKDLAEAYGTDESKEKTLDPSTVSQPVSHVSMTLKPQPRIVDRSISMVIAAPQKPDVIKDIHDFKRLREAHGYYVDKTHLLMDLIENGGLVTHFHRPLMFGKTLALSMIKAFFERECEPGKPAIENAKYFEGLHVMKSSRSVLCQMGQYPVVTISSDPVDEMECSRLISTVYRQWKWLLKENLLDEYDRKQFNVYLNRSTKVELAELLDGLKFLIELIYEKTGHRVVLLVDTYKSFKNEKEQKENNDLFSDLISRAVTDNQALERAVIMSEDEWPSIMEEDNITVQSRVRDEYFGFSELEVRNILRDFHLDDEYSFVKDWYGGVDVSGRDVFIPKGVLKFVQSMQIPGAVSSNVLSWRFGSGDESARMQLVLSGLFTRRDIALLIKSYGTGRSLNRELAINHSFSHDPWVRIMNHGLVKAVEQIPTGHGTFECKLVLPNRYAQYLLWVDLDEWFFCFWDKYFEKDGHGLSHRNALDHAIKAGDSEAVSLEFRRFYAALPMMDGNIFYYRKQLEHILKRLPFACVIGDSKWDEQSSDIAFLDSDNWVTLFGIGLVSDEMLESSGLSYLKDPCHEIELADIPKIDALVATCAQNARSGFEDGLKKEALKSKYAVELDIVDFRYYGIGFFRNRLVVR